MAKAVAIYVMVIVLIIAAMLFVSLLILFHWIRIEDIETNKATCSTKYLNYCLGYQRNNWEKPPFDWNEEPPKNCEMDPVNMNPPSLQDCKNMFSITD